MFESEADLPPSLTAIGAIALTLHQPLQDIYPQPLCISNAGIEKDVAEQQDK